MSRAKVTLENQIRKTIYKHIAEYPGVSFSTLKRFYDLNDSTLRYHLSYLERAEKITSEIEDGKLHYYLYNGKIKTNNSANVNLRAQELTPHQERILNTVKQCPGINQTELITETTLKRHILSYNIIQLIDLGMVRKINNGRKVCYEYITNDLLKYEMLKVLAIKFLNNEIDEQTYLKLRSRLKMD